MNITSIVKLASLLFTVALLSACVSTFEEIQKNNHHELSPDKKVVVYQSVTQNDGQYQIALTSWCKQNGSEGGAGIFAFISENEEQIQFNWESDSLLLVTIPKNVTIILQENESYFLGRSFKVNYIQPQKESPTPSWDTLRLTSSSLIIHSLDSIEMENLAKTDEESFYTAADDLMWYTAQLTSHLDSLQVPMVFTTSDYIRVFIDNKEFELVDTSTQSFQTIYELYTDSIHTAELFELMEKYNVE